MCFSFIILTLLISSSVPQPWLSGCYFLVFPFFCNGIIIDLVHRSGHSPNTSIMLLILCRMSIRGAPPAFISSAVMISVSCGLSFANFQIATVVQPV